MQLDYRPSTKRGHGSSKLELKSGASTTCPWLLVEVMTRANGYVTGSSHKACDLESFS
jgi:hypothetical protein